jgi:hypothetical protein
VLVATEGRDWWKERGTALAMVMGGERLLFGAFYGSSGEVVALGWALIARANEFCSRLP